MTDKQNTANTITTLFNTQAFNKADLIREFPRLTPEKIDDSLCYFTANGSSKIYNMVSLYVTEHLATLNSFSTKVTNQQEEIVDPLDVLKGSNKNPSNLLLGLGTFAFKFTYELSNTKSTNQSAMNNIKRIQNDSNTSVSDQFSLIILHQTIDQVVGTFQEAKQLYSLVVFTEISPKTNKLSFTHGKQVLDGFIETVRKWSESTIDSRVYKIFTFMTRNQFWRQRTVKIVRPADSVILPEATKSKLFTDVEHFMKTETCEWYYRHGIPYKRSYLFYGPPGCGKSSLITVLAGHLMKNLCFLQLGDPTMSDEVLSECLLSAPKNSIVVIEDIDALFDKNRDSLAKKTPLTFSGLLNSMDGICNPDGQIFIFTTNYIDRLDPALIRAGRVDLRVEFKLPTEEQIENMFLRFYEGEEKWAKEFVRKLVERVKKGAGKEGEEVRLSMAALQQHFIMCSTKSAEEAVNLVGEFDFDLFSVAPKKEEEEVKAQPEQEKKEEVKSESAPIRVEHIQTQ